MSAKNTGAACRLKGRIMPALLDMPRCGPIRARSNPRQFLAPSSGSPLVTIRLRRYEVTWGGVRAVRTRPILGFMVAGMGCHCHRPHPPHPVPPRPLTPRRPGGGHKGTGSAQTERPSRAWHGHRRRLWRQPGQPSEWYYGKSEVCISVQQRPQKAAISKKIELMRYIYDKYDIDI